MNAPIAIIGAGCRFPGGGDSARKFWDVLINGTDAIVDVPADRWDVRRFYSDDDQKPGKIYTTQGGFLREKMDQFDALFFGISPREAEVMDPQQRLLLETSYEAVEDAGLQLDALRGSNTGVFVGGFTFDNCLLQLGKDNRSLINSSTATGVMLTMLSNRLSYWYDFKGPSITIDTACSSSLVATHYAAQSIWRGECDQAMVGGVNAIFKPEKTITMSAGRFLSKHGRCKTFDADAAGYVRGEGAGIVILKPYEQALADGDKIYALIRATGVNQDGRTNGITVPNGAAQQQLMRKVYRAAGIQPRDIHYVEAHGTGTPVGDPIEFGALNEVLSEGRAAGDTCLVGSVKTNIGHLEAGAGVAGLIKAALCLQHKQVPPNLHFQTPNPRLNYEQSVLRVPTRVEALPPGGEALAAVNSFGYGGTNAHVLLQEYAPAPGSQPAPGNPEEPLAGPFVLPVSARDRTALKKLAHAYRAFLEANPGRLADFVYTAALRRSYHNHRLAVVADSGKDLLDKLAAFEQEVFHKGVVTHSVNERPPKIVFVCTGMGPQWWKMGRTLLEKEPVFRRSLEKCDAVFRSIASWSILEELKKDEERSRMKETQIAQPANFIIQVALAELLGHYGVTPGAVVGHSVGEVAAAYLAGALSLEDAMLVSYHRSRLQQTTAGQGKMMAVSLPEAEMARIIASTENVAIAAVNSPNSVTLAGDEDALWQLADSLEWKGVFSRMLEVEVPYHSPLMDPIREDLLLALEGIRPGAARLDLYSTVTGAQIQGDGLGPAYWWANVRQPVRFAAVIETLLTDGYDVFVEIGPHPVLKTSMAECLNAHKKAGDLVQTLNRKEPEQFQFYAALATLHALGCPLNWRQLTGSGAQIDIPGYPWQKSRHWLESPASQADRLGNHANVFLATRVPAPQPAYEVELNPYFFPFLTHHIVQGKVVFPGAGYVAAGIALLQAEAGEGAPPPFSVEDIAFHQLLAVDAQATQLLHTTLHPRLNEFTVYSRYGGEPDAWQLHASGRFADGLLGSPGDPVDLAAIGNSCPERIPPEAVYARLAEAKLEYGPPFRAIKEIKLGEGQLLARIEGPEMIAADAAGYVIHPVLLDACFQGMIAFDNKDMVPVSIRQLHCYRSPGNQFYCHIRLTEVTDQAVTGDLTLCGDDGIPALQLLGLRCQRIARDTSAGKELLEASLYAPRWKETAGPAARETETAEKYFLFSEENAEEARRLGLELSLAGKATVLVSGGAELERLSEHACQVDFASESQLTALFNQIEPSQVPVVLVYLPGAQLSGEGSASASACVAQITRLVNIVRAFARAQPARNATVCLVTGNAQVVVEGDAGDALVTAPLWGLGNVVMNEYPAFRVKGIDLEQQAKDDAEAEHAQLRLLVEEITGNFQETEIALRGGKKYVKRLVRKPAVAEVVVSQTLNTGEGGVVLRAGPSRHAEDLYFEQTPRQAPRTGEIELQVHQAAVEPSVYLKATGKLSPGAPAAVECTGIVTRVGAQVQAFRVGDRVVATGRQGEIRSYLTTSTDLVIHEPDGLKPGFALAATAYLTALYGLKDVARLKKDDKILIHHAAGSTGLAAVQYARWQGARVFATADTEEKRHYLRSLGLRHVYDSEQLQFAAQVLRDTGGYGVDVVLGALPGEGLYQSLSLLAPYGTYLDVGKKDQAERMLLPPAFFSRSVTLTSLDVDRMLAERPRLGPALLREVSEYFGNGCFTGVPVRRFPAGDAGEAFSQASENRLPGKVYLDMDQQPVAVRPGKKDPALVRKKATYLLTGSTDGLGLEIAKWLVTRGARHLVLVSRSGVKTEKARQAVAAMEKAGAQVRVESVDVSDAEQVNALIDRVKQQMPPLAGVVHCAMVLDDGLLTDMTPDRFDRVLRPKVDGALHLHRATSGAKLDHFICFSSISSLIGNPGQANYVAANAFLDAFGHYRQSLGLVGTTINLGVLSEVGVVARSNNLEKILQHAGIQGFTTAEVLEGLELIMHQQPAQVGFFRVNWQTWASGNPKSREFSPFRELLEQENPQAKDSGKQDLLVEALGAMEPENRHPHLVRLLGGELADVLRMPFDSIDASRGINLLGLDSIMVVELINAIRNNLGVAMVPMEFLTGPSVSQLAAVVLHKLPLAGREEKIAAL